MRRVRVVIRGRGLPGRACGAHRAKLMWDGVSAEVLAAAVERGELRATVGLTDGCGMPVCAAVRPPGIVWAG